MEYQDFPSQFFCLTAGKSFIGNPPVLQKTSDMEKLYGYGGEERHDFPSKLSCFTVPEIFVEHIFSVSLVSRMTIVYA